MACIYFILSTATLLATLLVLYQTRANWNSTKRCNQTLSLLNKKLTEQNLLLQENITTSEASEIAQKNLIRIVAHDLRGPMGAIVGLTGLLLEKNTLPEEHKPLITLIKNSSSDAIKFVNDLLELENNLPEVLEKDIVDLHKLLKYCGNLLRYKADEKAQKIVVSGKPLTIQVNREKISRVFSNLITNALKFSAQLTTIHITMETFSNHVLISVSDPGIGIPLEIQRQIFKQDEHLIIAPDCKRAGTNGEKSFGMGLMICKQIVESHRGKIWFESEVNQGTTFFVKLPV